MCFSEHRELRHLRRSGCTYVLVCDIIPITQGEEGSEGLGWAEWKMASGNVMAGIMNAMSRCIKSVISDGERTQRHIVLLNKREG